MPSSDCTVMNVKAGESLTTAKGWTGEFETKGYKKIYAIYDVAATKK